MPINNPPIRDPLEVFAQEDRDHVLDAVRLGSRWTPPWAQWFTQVISAIFGWRKTYTTTKINDFGSISAQSQATTTVTLTGARVGDAVLVRPTTAVDGIIMDGTVTAPDVVTIRAVNYSAAPIDPASQTYRVIVFQQ